MIRDFVFTAQCEAGALLSEDALDAMAIATNWDVELDAPFCHDRPGSSGDAAPPPLPPPLAPPSPQGRPSKKAKAAKMTTPLLGELVDGCPPEVHEAMERLAREGIIPVTTPIQRIRARGTSGSTYGVPDSGGLAQAREFGFIGPNLPPPPANVWRLRACKWVLCLKGG